MFQPKILLLLLILCIFGQLLSAQQKIVISGTVYEKGSKEHLPGVSVYAFNQKKGTSSNNYGYYSLTLEPGEVELIVVFAGYNKYSFKKNLLKDTTINILLDPENVLDEVDIVAKDQEKISESTQMSTIDIPIEQIKKIPALLGEKDVLKVIQLLPGVQKGSEGSSGLYVRGGGPDQNLIILDDAPVYNAYHLFGFFSLFNGDALKSVELTKGGFPARYGGRLSSVIEMQMKDGNKEKLTGEAGIGIISSRFTLEGPVKKGKSSFLVSGRRTYIDALIYPFLPEDRKGGYYFYDFNAKLNFDLDEKNRIFVSGYFGRDKFYSNFKSNGSSDKATLKWGNATGTLRWNHIFSNKIFANASIIFTHYNLGIGYLSKVEDGSFFELDYRSGIRDLGAKYDVDIYANSNHHIKIGMVSTWHYFTPSATVISSSFAPDNKNDVNPISAIENGVYIEDDWKISQRIKTNIGFRLSHFNVMQKNYVLPEPRLAIRYSINDELSIKAGYSYMNQYLHLLSNTGLGLPTDLWVPATNRIKPQQSQQIAAGIAKDFTKHGFTLTVEGYWKNMNDILGYKDGASFLFIGEGEQTGLEWQDNVTAGKGKSYGGEILLQKKKGKWNGWIGYTLSWTKLQFDSINFGQPFYAKYDRRHDFSIVGIYQLNDHISISATWVYGTGNAITLPKSEYNAVIHELYPFNSNLPNLNNYFVSDYGSKNDFRMAAYHRADIGVQFTKKKKNRERIFELSVYNVYNRKNPFFYYIGSSESDPSKRVLKQVSLFPIIPSVSWTIKF